MELAELGLEDLATFDRIVIEFPIAVVNDVALFEGEYLANGKVVASTTKPEGGYAFASEGTLILNNFVCEGKGVDLDIYLYSLIFSFGDLDIELVGENTLTQVYEGSYVI